ncbi:beta-galactosidase [Microterricola gilva]|uniref:Beta-galactosidase n=2 Tax=Microterricola gilva TaxID=393267 RepID=A0A4Q8AJ87_9MICO|nr:beta-galactosidase [Microterricola gilva]
MDTMKQASPPSPVLSGAVHYFRSLPEQWPNLMRSLKAMGLNTVETYLAWNVHEPREGEWQRLDEITRFLDCAHAEGLRTIVRPGPYICAEWDNGGLPSWLTGRVGKHVRTRHPEFLDAVERYLDAVVPTFAEHPSLLMVQVENEYGSFGSDAVYLGKLTRMLAERGITVPLFTSDGWTDACLTAGMIPGIPATVNFGSDAPAAFGALARYRPDDAPFCMEFWNGWFDHWGQQHVTRAADDAAESLAEILDADGSVNLYMAHGGTNFGVGAGANHHDHNGADEYRPTVTSYDYDSALDERGAPTPKFRAFRDVLAARGAEMGELPELPPLMPDATVPLTRTAEVVFDDRGAFAVAPTFEELGIDHGLVRYEVPVAGPREALPLEMIGLRDRAHVYVDDELLAIVDRDGDTSILPPVAGGSIVSVVIESMGRVNYGPRLGEHKGLTGLRQGLQWLNGYTVSTHALPELRELTWSPNTGEPVAGMRYYQAEVQLTEQADGYLEVPGGAKGYVWFNELCLGRYWNRGPQTRLYVPWPATRVGANVVTVLELDGLTEATVSLSGTPGLG